MRIDKRKGLNEVTQQGSHSSQHVIFSSELSGYIMRVYTESIHCCSLNLIPSISVQSSIRSITFEWEICILEKHLLLFYIFVLIIKSLLNFHFQVNDYQKKYIIIVTQIIFHKISLAIYFLCSYFLRAHKASDEHGMHIIVYFFALQKYFVYNFLIITCMESRIRKLFYNYLSPSIFICGKA